MVTVLLLLASVISTEGYCSDGGTRGGGNTAPTTSRPEGRGWRLNCWLSVASMSAVLQMYRMA